MLNQYCKIRKIEKWTFQDESIYGRKGRIIRINDSGDVLIDFDMGEDYIHWFTKEEIELI